MPLLYALTGDQTCKLFMYEMNNHLNNLARAHLGVLVKMLLVGFHPRIRNSCCRVQEFIFKKPPMLLLYWLLSLGDAHLGKVKQDF